MITAYAAALARGDAEGAYRLLSPQDRAAQPLDTFRQRLAANPAEARELAGRLARAPAPRVLAETTLDDGSQIALAGTPSGFGLLDPLLRFYDQSSPRAALVTFVRAVERSRWDVLLGLMPRADRAQLDAAGLGARLASQRDELASTAARLWQARDQPFEVVGDRATMVYGESFSARFLREDGLWRVESPE